MRRDTLATALAFSLTSAAAVGVSSWVTDGFAAFTLESARRLEVQRAPRGVAYLTFTTPEGVRAELAHYAGRWVLVDFIYTRCETLCVSLGSVYSQLQQRLSTEIAAGHVQLLSVSFDPTHDGPRELIAYRARHGGSTLGWDMGRPSQDDVARWLSVFGVRVIADEWGGFAHNAAIHLIGPDGRLREIFDIGSVEEVVRHVKTTFR